MDSRSSRLPFCLSSSRSSYTSSSGVSSSTLGSRKLYSTDTTLNSDRFPRASSVFKTEPDQQSSRLRDYGSSHSPTSWRLPSSLTSSTRAYDRPWAESSLTSRNKMTDTEGRLGMRSNLLNTIDDGESKRAKLSYSNRVLYSQPASTMGSSLSSSSRADKENGARDSSWSSPRSLSRLSSSSSSSSSSKPLFPRRELETKVEPSYSGLGERRTRTTGLTSSLYQTDRVTSTYAQGARPKETAFASTSTPARESRHLLSSTSHHSSLVRDLSSRTTSRSSATHSSHEPTAGTESAPEVPTSSSQTRHSSSRSGTSLPPRPAAEGSEIEGRSSTRRLLSRLFSRRSSQYSSESSSVRSVEEDGPSTESVDSDEALSNVDPGLTEAVGRRQRGANLNPIRENGGGHRRSLATWREPAVMANRSGAEGSGASWLSSSLRSRCPPLIARLRRYAREESGTTSSSPEYTYSRPSYLRRRDDQEHDEEEEEDDDDEEEEEEKEGAVGSSGFDADHSHRTEDEVLPDLEEVSHLPRRRPGLIQNISIGPLGGEKQLEDQNVKAISSKDQEKLRKIKERLLMEDSDEEEGDLCRICQMGEESATNPLIQPCRCTGSLQYVHQDCIKRWLRSKISSGTNLEGITTCELCKEKLHLNLVNFDIQELYRTHVQSEYDDFISSGLYLVVLLHFCEQRFSNIVGAVNAAGLFNLGRILDEHADSLESSSEGEAHDSLPSIEFSDLDDDLEDY